MVRRAVGRLPQVDQLLARPPFVRLGWRRQLRELHRAAKSVLPRFGLNDARVRLLNYEDSAVYRATTLDERFVLRLVLSGGDAPAELRSEMEWLAALRRDTDLEVPEPIRTADDQYVTRYSLSEGTEAVACLVGWVPGRLLQSAPTPSKLAAAGAMTARFTSTPGSWTRPDGLCDRGGTSSGFSARRPGAFCIVQRDSPLLGDRGNAVVEAAAGQLVTRNGPVKLGAGCLGSPRRRPERGELRGPSRPPRDNRLRRLQVEYYPL